MLKRLDIYFKERFPIVPRVILSIIVFLEMYFILLLNYGITKFQIGIQEFIGGFTIFSFLLMLRIVDDFKDYETDKRLFPDRPVADGRTKIKDLALFLTVLVIGTILLNMKYMNNTGYFIFLYTYGTLMSFWFFQRHKIQNNLPLALITHNPIQIILNIYVISFTCIKYGLSMFTLTAFLMCFTLYFPALIWEVSRKIRAPKDEDDYTTYSKVWGYKKATKFVMVCTIIDIITNFLLVYRLNKIAIFALALLVTWMTIKFMQFIKDPTRFELVKVVETYTFLQESVMLITVVVYLVVGRV